MAEVAEKAVKKTTKKAAEKLLDSDVDIYVAQQVANDVIEQARTKDTPLPQDVMDDIDEMLEAIPQGPHPVLLVGAGLALGLAIGGYIGFRFAEKKMAAKFEALLEEETQQIKEHYHQKMLAKKDKPSPDEMADLAAFRKQQDEGQQLSAELGYKPEGEILQVATEQSEARDAERLAKEKADAEAAEIVNAFEQRDRQAEAQIPQWDYSRELKSRDPRKPYVIHVDEWRENDGDYTLKDLTFYEADSVLADDDDNVVDHQDEAIGLDNLDRFGHGSGDVNTVFIRNDVSEILYEVARSYGSYAQEVHGFDPDQLQHSERHRGRHRFDDD